MFSKISQKTQENNCGRFSFLIKIAGLRHVFFVNLVKFLGTHFLQNTSGQLLLRKILRSFQEKHINEYVLKNLEKLS